jgi:sodium/potassium-transporting ATPase subunit alpha
VRGDIVHVKAGEKIPADLRVVSTREGRVDKSALTGEPDAIPLAVVCTDKNHHESRNLAQFGTLLTEGEVTGMVIATGPFTMMGGISKMVNEAGSSQTTLHVEVNHFVQIGE